MIQPDGRKAIARGILARLIPLALATALAACSGSDAAEKEGNFSSDPETAKIEKIVREYIINNPEVLELSLEEREARGTAKLIEPYRKQIETPYAGAWAGARDGDVTLVEFFDYACGYCKASNETIDRLLKEDKNLKVVYRDLPVLGPQSIVAAQASLAAARQGRFKTFYDTLYAQEQPSDAAITKAQRTAGVTPARAPDYAAEFDKNHEIARNLGGTGTPMFVVGDRILLGMQSYESLKKAIDRARRKAA